jgi:hypothetical protein
MSGRVASEGASFVVARNPQADSKLPYLLRLRRCAPRPGRDSPTTTAPRTY